MSCHSFLDTPNTIQLCRPWIISLSTLMTFLPFYIALWFTPLLMLRWTLVGIFPFLTINTATIRISDTTTGLTTTDNKLIVQIALLCPVLYLLGGGTLYWSTWTNESLSTLFLWLRNHILNLEKRHSDTSLLLHILYISLIQNHGQVSHQRQLK